MDHAIAEYARAKGFRQETLDRWLGRPEEDSQALLELVRDLRVGENHLRDFLDWLEEISLRDGVGFSQILGSEAITGIRSDPRLGRNDKLKRIKGEVRRLRFPRLAKVEGEIQRRIRAMKPGPGVRIEVPLNLEGGTVNVEMRASSHEELRRLAGELHQLLEQPEMKEIFDLLTGGA